MKAVAVAMGALFVAACAWIYGPAFFSVIHSDVASNVLIAVRELATRSPVPRDFYFANGDVWMLGPHQLAVPLVPVFGSGPTTLRLTLILAILVEALVLYASYLHFTKRRAIATLGAVTTLGVWSRLSVLFVYVEPSYGFLATVYLGAFVLAAPGTRGRRRDIATAVGVLLLTLQNPQRAGVFVLAPLLVATLWPWRALARRPRASALVAAALGFVIASAVYVAVLRPGTTTSIPSGRHAFVMRDAAGIATNLRTLARGALVVSGDSPTFGLTSLPGLVVILGALALVVREIVSSREVTARRFICVAALAQLGAVLLPLVLGNLLIDERSIRYLLPSLLLLLGLGAVVAADDGNRAVRAWLVTMPVAVALAFLRVITQGIASPADAWAENRDAKRVLADELVRRDLTRGFATYWNANILTLLSSGRTRTCSVGFDHTLVPYKWTTDATCFSLAEIPGRFYVAWTESERAAIADLAPSLPAPIETFDAGGAFHVNVYETARSDMRWLQLPIPEAPDLRFPFSLPANHLAIRKDKAVVEGTSLVATGEPGTVAFGPYIELPKGHFVVRWTGQGVDAPGTLAFDVAAAGQSSSLARLELPSTQVPREAGAVLTTLAFDLAKPTPGIEFRVWSRDGAKVVLTAATIERR